MNHLEIGVLEGSSRYFHTPGHRLQSIFFYPLCLGDYRCDHRYFVKRHTYNSYLLMYIVEGKGTIEYDHQTYTVTKGDIVLINCYQKHAYETSGWHIYWLHFDGNASSEFFHHLYQRSGCIFKGCQSSDIVPLFTELLRLFEVQVPIHEATLSSKIHQLLSLLFECPSEGTGDAHHPSPITTSIDFMKNHYDRSINITELARLVALSPYHFSRLFKLETGYAPYEYLIMLRITEAKQLLKNSSLRVKEIAFSVGFNSESSFVTSFKSHTGYTPSQFRQITL